MQNNFIYRFLDGRWLPMQVIAETDNHWLARDAFGRVLSAPKHGGEGWAFSKEEADSTAWMSAARQKIIEKLKICKDLPTMKKAARIFGLVDN